MELLVVGRALDEPEGIPPDCPTLASIAP